MIESTKKGNDQESHIPPSKPNGKEADTHIDNGK